MDEKFIPKLTAFIWRLYLLLLMVCLLGLGLGRAQVDNSEASIFCKASADTLKAHLGREVYLISGAKDDNSLFDQPELHDKILKLYPEIQRSGVIIIEKAKKLRDRGEIYYYGFYALPATLTDEPEIVLIIVEETSGQSSHCIYDTGVLSKFTHH